MPKVGADLGRALPGSFDSLAARAVRGDPRFPDSRLSSVRPRGRTDPIQHIAHLEAAGQFPRRVKLGPDRVVWLLSEVDA
ncbi:MAG TPA: AlpA family phage regulatory protein [Azospirillum sp.]|nr:AlpA family phage regulatory protein [Azospirillum sp.]